MKYAVFSDIHGHPDSLQRALDDARQNGAEEFLCLGDVVGYGPDPVKALALSRDAFKTVLMGNHDAAVAGVMPTDGFVPFAQQGVARHRALLAQSDCDWLESLPYVAERADASFVHGSMWHPEHFNYVMSAWDAKRCLQSTPGRIAFVGHLHVSMSWVWRPKRSVPDLGPRDALTLEPGCRYVVNVGSVGYPRVEDCSTYVLYDDAAGRVEFHRLPFDDLAYAEALKNRGVGLPLWLSDRLMRMLAQLEKDGS